MAQVHPVWATCRTPAQPSPPLCPPPLLMRHRRSKISRVARTGGRGCLRLRRCRPRRRWEEEGQPGKQRRGERSGPSRRRSVAVVWPPPLPSAAAGRDAAGEGERSVRKFRWARHVLASLETGSLIGCSS